MILVARSYVELQYTNSSLQAKGHIDSISKIHEVDLHASPPCPAGWAVVVVSLCENQLLLPTEELFHSALRY